MKDIDGVEFEPVPFPEVKRGFVFNVNFRRNSTCPNFGPAPNPDDYADLYSVVRHKIIGTDRSDFCKTCKISSQLLSNRSLRSLAKIT